MLRKLLVYRESRLNRQMREKEIYLSAAYCRNKEKPFLYIFRVPRTTDCAAERTAGHLMERESDL